MHAVQKKTVKINYKNKLPWMNTIDIREAIDKREKLLDKKNDDPSPENREEFRIQRNKVISMNRRAERIYYKEQLELNDHDIRKSWNVIRDIIGREGKHIKKLEADFCINGKLISDPLIVANHFNDYFVNIGRSLASKINCNIDPLQYVKPNPNIIDMPNIDTIAVEHVVSMLKNSAAGHDGVPGSIMKQCIHSIIVPLTYILNLSVAQGYFPNELKIAKVLPIYKADDAQLLQNYRPISVLPFFSKVFEKLICNHIIDFLDNNDIFYDKQFGFRKAHSTSHAIITLIERVSRALDTGKIVVGVFLDLKKAFDTVNHGILL